MNHSLTIYKNLQHNPIEIAPYAVLEIYKDSIAKANSLGYCILPLDGVTDITTAIRNKVAGSAPSGYTDLAIMGGRVTQTYNHKRVYCVWYQGTAPAYPDAPVVGDVREAAEPINPEQETIVTNTGANTECSIRITVREANKKAEFYINDDYYSIVLDGTKGLVATLSKDGLRYGNSWSDAFTETAIPHLESGDNVISANKSNITNLQINYNYRY